MCFCGGPLPTSIWLTRESIISYLKFIGFTDIKISFESTDHPNGPSFNLCATRVPSRRPDEALSSSQYVDSDPPIHDLPIAPFVDVRGGEKPTVFPDSHYAERA